MTFLLDANVVIALASPNHQHHHFATRWLMSIGAFATCPVTEGALIRYVKHLSPSETAAPRYLLGMIGQMSGHEFWPDDLSYQAVDLELIRGHKQVTDAYLVALARKNGGKLATFDEALAALYPEVELVPTEPNP